MNKSIKPIVLAVFIAASAGVAHAEGDGGDNSMTPFYGDSWADLQAHDPQAVTVPSMTAQEDAAEARAAWGRTRDRMRGGVERMRDSTSDTMQRMTGRGATGATTDGTMSGNSGNARMGTTGATSADTGRSTGTSMNSSGPAPIPKQSTEDNPQSRNGSGSWNTGSPRQGGETDPAVRNDGPNSPVGPSVGGSSR